MITIDVGANRTIKRQDWKLLQRHMRIMKREMIELKKRREIFLREFGAFGTAIMNIPGRPNYFRGSE